MPVVSEQHRSASSQQKWDPELVQRQTVERLMGEFGGLFSHETITLQVAEALEHFEGVKIKDFVPIFVERNTQERLRGLLQGRD